jgi:hypothetical protein
VPREAARQCASVAIANDPGGQSLAPLAPSTNGPATDAPFRSNSDSEPEIAPQGYADENGACNAGSLCRGDPWAISQFAAVGAIEPAIVDTRELTSQPCPCMAALDGLGSVRPKRRAPAEQPAALDLERSCVRMNNRTSKINREHSRGQRHLLRRRPARSRGRPRPTRGS